MGARRFLLALALAAAFQLGATGSDGGCGNQQVTRDPGFELWCGDSLCTWKLLRGEIERAPTWHENDAGVRFLGEDTAIAQLTPVESADGTCIEFSLLADIDARAEVVLDLDIGGDGSVEHSERFSTGSWHSLRYALNIQPPYRGVLFIIRKAGPGSAVVAQIDADVIDAAECAGFTPIVAEPSHNGAPCDDPADCQSGQCLQINMLDGAPMSCAGCDPFAANACGSGMVCGRGEPLTFVRDIPHECVPSGSDPLGALCNTDAECASNLCTLGRCSTCRETCAGSETCDLAYTNGPSVCSPGGGLRASGEPCAVDADCASGDCTGTDRYQCIDGRECPGGDRNFCPPMSSTLEPGECNLVGVEGGTCS